jgi:hypothetical protein
MHFILLFICLTSDSLPIFVSYSFLAFPLIFPADLVSAAVGLLIIVFFYHHVSVSYVSMDFQQFLNKTFYVSYNLFKLIFGLIICMGLCSLFEVEMNMNAEKFIVLDLCHHYASCICM